MKGIARFFTLYWMIYFPTCIAFNDIRGFSSIDEVMTALLIVVTFVVIFLQTVKWRIANGKIIKEYFVFLGLLAFYILYSLVMKVNTASSVLYDVVQQIRPWSIVFCTWMLNPRFNGLQKKLILASQVISLVGLFFVHPELADVQSEYRSVPMGQLAICTSMTWFLFTRRSRMNTFCTVFIAVIGLLCLKFKYYGEFGAWMFTLFYMHKKIKFNSSNWVWQLAVLLVIVVFLGWERFDAYYVSGMSETKARPELLKTTWTILCDYFPFGSGFGTYGTAASAVHYSPLYYQYNLSDIWGLGNYNGNIGFHCDVFFATFAQIGFVGIFFFVWFWIRRIKEINAIMNFQYYKVAMMTLFCMVIEWFGDSSFLSGKGMGYLMIMALCLNANRNIEDKKRRYLILQKRKQQESELKMKREQNDEKA